MNTLQRLAYVPVAACMVAFAAPLSATMAQSVRDSAGIRIAENARPLLTEERAPRLASTPLLDLDPTKGADYNFGGVVGVLRFADGRVFVAARTSPQFRLFDANGRLLHATDERGAPDNRASTTGQSITRLKGDTIAVLYRRDAAWFVVAGDSLRQVSAPRQAPRGPPSEIVVSMLTNGGGAYMRIPSPPKRAAGTQWADSTNLVLRDRDGALVRDLGALPHITLEMTKDEMTSVWLAAIGVPCAGAGRFFYGFGNEFSIRVYSDGGALQSIIRRAWTPTPVSAADWEHWVIEWSKLWVKERGADSIKAIQRVRESPYAFELPAFAGCIVTQDGNLWVREAHLDDAISAGSLSDDPIVPSKWSIFNPAGRWLSDVIMPAGFQPTDIGSDYVAGRFRKGPGRTTVAVYRFAVNAR